MDPISRDTAVEFCKLCDGAYQSWVMHKDLFDENKTAENNFKKCARFTARLSIITQEYCLQQMAKLHDPAIQRNSLNLTIEYMVRFGEWGERKVIIEEIHDKLQVFWNSLGKARNKILAHNDLETLMANATLGTFTEGADNKYFDTLQFLVDEVHEKWVGGPFPFDDLVRNDVAEFLTLLERTESPRKVQTPPVSSQ